MTTARTLITSALRNINVLGDSQVLKAADAASCLVLLNDLLDAWKIEHLFSRATVEYTGTAAGAETTIGPGGDVDVTFVPTRIENGFVRAGGVDYPFALINYAEYAGIAMKGNASPYPAVGYYDGAGSLFLYPVPTGAELHIAIASQMSEFATLNTDYTLDPGVRRALSLSLAEEAAPSYGAAVSPLLAKQAKDARRALKRRNFRTPQLQPMTVDTSSEAYAFGGGGATSYDGIDGGTP